MSGADLGFLEPIAYTGDEPTAYIDKDCNIWKPTQNNLRVVPEEQLKAAGVGIGGAPARASILPEGAKERKTFPIASGLMDYFPDALAVVSNVSYRGGQQHHPDKPLHWDRNKSTDEADTMLRHFLQRGSLDTDGIRHTAKCAWRCLAMLQKEIEAENAEKNPRS